jgi:hypothetical protein
MIGGLAISCLDSPDCYNLNNSTVGIGFRKMYDGKADTVALISVRATDTDSVFYPYKLVNGILFPLDFTADRTFLYFDQPDGTRQLTLSYTSQAQFVSEECGERYILDDLGVVSHEFDSVRVLSSTITRDPSTNIYIYRCPINDRAKFTFHQLYADKDTVGKPLKVKVNGIYADYAGLVFPEAEESSYRLPVNPSSNTTEFTFDFPEGQQSISIGYQQYFRTLFSVCGEQALYGGVKVLSSDFPITKLRRDTLQDPPITNVLFQKCPTNNLMKLVFKKSSATNANNDTVAINRIRADYTTEVFYEDSEVTTVTLPLNIDADETTFTFEFEGGNKELTVSYVRTSKVYHELCGATTEMASLAVVSSDFLTPIKVTNTAIKFPTVTNLEVVND